MLKKDRRGRFWASLVIFSLIGQIAWVVENMYFNVFIYNMFSADAGDISLMVAASSVVATLTTIFIGALSDRMGRRRIFISAGYIAWGISILSFAAVREDFIAKLFPDLLMVSMAGAVSGVCITLTIILDCVMTFFGSSANDACFNAWLTDATRDGERGRAEGINSMMPLLAILAVFGGFMSFDLKKGSSWTAIFCIIGSVVIAIGIASFFLIEEAPIRTEKRESYLNCIIYSFLPRTVANNPVLYAAVGAFAIFNISIQIFMPYLIIYYEVSLGMKDYVLIMAPAIILAGIATAFYGRYYDKVGFKRAAIPSLIALASGYVILILFTSTLPVFIGSLLMMTGYLTGMAVFGAILRDKTPEGRAGAFQGIRIVGQVLIPGIVGPAIGAAVLKDAEVMIGNDGRESFIPNSGIFIAALIVAAIAFASVFAVQAISNRKTNNEKN